MSKLKRETVFLMLACNDERGNPQGWIDRVDVQVEGETILELGGCYGSHVPQFSHTKSGSVKIGHIEVPILGYHGWVGNWCWDAITVTPEEAARVLNYLKRHKWFTAEGGFCEPVDTGKLWDDPAQSFSADTFKTFQEAGRA